MSDTKKTLEELMETATKELAEQMNSYLVMVIGEPLEEDFDAWNAQVTPLERVAAITHMLYDLQ